MLLTSDIISKKKFQVKVASQKTCYAKYEKKHNAIARIIYQFIFYVNSFTFSLPVSSEQTLQTKILNGNFRFRS